LDENNAEIAEIRLTEERRAQTAREDVRLEQWVKQLRQKYIVNGFLMPFYAWDEKYSRPRKRIKEFGDFILHCDTAGKVFDAGTPRGWIGQEDMWFWDYLIGGQEAIFNRPRSTLLESCRVTGIPADHVWNMLVNFAGQMGLFGEKGGGLLISPDLLEENKLTRVVPKNGVDEGDNGYLEPYQIAGEHYWITLFHRYEEPEYIESAVEIRPAWFHLANYAFFNVPISRLPVFLGVFAQENIDRIRYLDQTLSIQARKYIGNALHDIPIELKNQSDDETLKREKNEMTWWLWRNVGHLQYRRTLSYGRIAGIAHAPRSSIQTSVERFDQKLKDKLDGKMLEKLLRASNNLGLGLNMTYNTLVSQGLAPAREREIDGFDELDKLI
jgi:hypothetical protein